MKKLDEAGAVLLTLAAGLSAQADDVLDQSFHPSDVNLISGITGIIDKAQTFTVGVDGLLSRVDVWVSNVGPIEGNLVVDIRPTVDGVPVESETLALAWATILHGQAPMPDQYYRLDIDHCGVLVEVGDVLAIALRSSSPDMTVSSDWQWTGQQANPYPGGELYFRNDLHVPDWVADANGGNEVAFRTYVRVPTPAMDADECADMTSISGVGTFLFDSSNDATDGPVEPLCGPVTEGIITDDLWYCWTAACTGPVTLSTCGQTDVDTKVVVYEGCACFFGTGGPIVCNADDPDCGDQSTVTWAATEDEQYMIRLGTDVAPFSGGPGAFTITCDQSCPGDTNGDGVVNVDDLNNVFLDWGTNGSANGGDVTGPFPGSCADGVVDVNDLNAVFVNWGDCP